MGVHGTGDGFVAQRPGNRRGAAIGDANRSFGVGRELSQATVASVAKRRDSEGARMGGGERLKGSGKRLVSCPSEGAADGRRVRSDGYYEEAQSRRLRTSRDQSCCRRRRRPRRRWRVGG